MWLFPGIKDTTQHLTAVSVGDILRQDHFPATDSGYIFFTYVCYFCIDSPLTPLLLNLVSATMVTIGLYHCYYCYAFSHTSICIHAPAIIISHLVSLHFIWLQQLIPQFWYLVTPPLQLWAQYVLFTFPSHSDFSDQTFDLWPLTLTSAWLFFSGLISLLPGIISCLSSYSSLALLLKTLIYPQSIDP